MLKGRKGDSPYFLQTKCSVFIFVIFGTEQVINNEKKNRPATTNSKNALLSKLVSWNLLLSCCFLWRSALFGISCIAKVLIALEHQRFLGYLQKSQDVYLGELGRFGKENVSQFKLFSRDFPEISFWARIFFPVFFEVKLNYKKFN